MYDTSHSNYPSLSYSRDSFNVYYKALDRASKEMPHLQGTIISFPTDSVNIAHSLKPSLNLKVTTYFSPLTLGKGVLF